MLKGCVDKFGIAENVDEAEVRAEVNKILDALAQCGTIDKTKPRFKLLQFSEIKLSTNQPYVVKGMLPKPALAVGWGKPKCGKTFWSLDLAMHIALGLPFQGKRVTQGHVVYCALEGKSGINKRIEAFRQYKLQSHGTDVPFSLMLSPLRIVKDHQELIANIRYQLGSNIPAAISLISTQLRSSWKLSDAQ